MTNVPFTLINSRLPDAPRPKVSVAMITYNHERFITQAVESVMMQETNFPYELVISDDCSPDRTREIVTGLQQKYPDRLRLVLPEQNLGAKRNYVQNLRACTGQYIAILEGDDFWTDRHKLQKQVDLLEAQPQLAGCFALTRVVGADDSARSFFIPAEHTTKTTIALDDLLEKNCIATCSLLFRNIVAEIDFDTVAHLKMGDWPLNLVLAERGPIGYLPEEMAAYRQHEGGIWTSISEAEKLKATADMYEAMRGVLSPRVRPVLARRLAKTHQLISLELLRSGDKRSSRNFAWRSIRWLPGATFRDAKWLFKRSVVLLLGSFCVPLPKVEAGLR